MSNWKTYKYSPKKNNNSIKNATVPILLLVIFVGFVFLAYIGITTFVKNLDKIGLENEITTGKTRVENIQPPLLSNIPRFTKEKSITIEGYSVEKAKITLYKNGKNIKETVLKEAGDFKFENIILSTGEDEFYATATNEDKVSIPSSKLSISVDTEAPKLSISSPSDNGDEITAKKSEELITVSGTTDPEVELTINDRIASVNDKGEFSVTINVKEGTNTLTAEAIDQAGNKTKVEFDFEVKFSED